MGDHRATVKVEMYFHGIRDRHEWWINWTDSDSECPGVDQRVIDWFRSIHERGMAKYSEEMFEYFKEEREKTKREAELAELERLKAKYG